MRVPILTKTQKQKTLNSQKKKKKNSIRNVLSYTNKNVNSNHLSNEQKESIINCLKKNMNNDNLKYMICGLNAVTRAVEQNGVFAVLIAEDVNPALMVKHLEQACTERNIPIARLNKLRSVVNKCLGFPTMVIAFKPYHAFESIQQIIRSNSTVATISINHIPAKVSETSDEIKIEEKSTVFSYLYREENEKKRCFVPPSTLPQHEKTQNNKETTDFIGFEEPETSNNYKPLKIVRVKGNAKRKLKTKK